jgi:murein DD-endopeptidase MepM/ murein hydrolase activator NlpD
MTANDTEVCTLHNAQMPATPRAHWGLLLTTIVVSVVTLLLMPCAARAQDIAPTESTNEPLELLDDAKPDVDYTVRPPNLGLESYTVVEGDTLSGIASQFGLKQKTIIWANPALQANPSRLSVGQELWVLPIDGALHTIASGDNLLGIARQYGVSVEEIAGCYYNPLIDPLKLKVGDQILVPGATRAVHQPRQALFSAPLPADAPEGTGLLIWPVSGYITQGYHTGHYAIDIGSWNGKPIAAADAGFVIRAGWDDTGYGFVVIIEHSNGIQTLYAHLSDFRVEAGESVAQGDTIGLMGASGNATGPHLHFEVVVNGVRQNPIEYLP